MSGKGVAGEVAIDWPGLIAKEALPTRCQTNVRRLFASKGIDAYHGRARFTGRTTMDVEGVTLEAEQILIASGAGPIESAFRVPST